MMEIDMANTKPAAKKIILIETREYVFLLPNERNTYSKHFLKEFGDSVESELPGSGGILEMRVLLWTPHDEVFYGFSYKGDLEGWRRYIDSGAKELGMAYAKMQGGEFVLSTGANWGM
jgi:hypothetical protein